MAAYDIKKQLQSLRVDSGRRKSRKDPFADFDDDSDDERRSRSKNKQEKEKTPSSVAAPRKSSKVSSPKAAEDELLEAPKRTDRHPSPAPAQLASLRVSEGAGRRGSLDQGLQGGSLLGRGVQTTRAPRSAVAQAAGTLAYLDDSSSEDEEPQRPSRANRYPSPAPRKQSDSVEPAPRSPTPSGTREPAKEAAVPPKHTVASPFAGTKYLQDSESDSDEDVITSRSGSIESTLAPDTVPSSPEKDRLDVKRVDKPKPQNGGGMSWRAFSAGRAEQRNTEIEALQASLKQRGKSISFGTHAVTDDGNRVPIVITPDQIFAGSTRGRRKGRGKSPPRRGSDEQQPDEEDEGERGGGPVGVYDPAQYKTNPFTGLSPLQTTTRRQSATETGHDRQAAPMAASQISAYTISPTSDVLGSPTDTSALENSTGSLTSKMTVSPPQTIPEGKPLDQPMSPVLSPTEDAFGPLSRNSSARSIRVGSRPTRIPTARRSTRRSTSLNPSPSPAHAFLSSWSKDSGSSDTPAEPKPDDEGQAIGLNNEYIIGRTINQGGFGVVKEVHSMNASGEPIVRAVKIVRKAIQGRSEADNEKAQQELDHEVSIWRHLKHRHVLDLIAVYDTDFATFCVMDLNIGGTLFDLVRHRRASAPENEGRKGLESKFAKLYAFQLASALRYLHEDIRVCHRDVKLENCLIDTTGPNAVTEGGVLRLCDFGLADFLHSESSIDDTDADNLALPQSRIHTRTASSIIGTLEYASPKGIAANRKLFETAGDVWAFGVIIYALCTGELPFRHAMPSKTVEMIMQAEWDDRVLAETEAGGTDVRELVLGCLERDVDLRMTIGEALRSEWFAECRDTVDGAEAGAEGWRSD